MKTLFAILFTLASYSSQAGIIAATLSELGPLNLTKYENDYATAFSSAEDYFRRFVVGVNDHSLPQSLIDNSNLNSSDRLGIVVPSSQFGAVFAVSDTVNADNPNGWAETVWEFDLNDHLLDFISIEFAAMGDFEGADKYQFDYQIDDSPFMPLFDIEADLSSNQSYRLSSGIAVQLNDPISVNNIALTNQFKEVQSNQLNINGERLAIRFSAVADAGTEVFAFRNMHIFSTSSQELNLVSSPSHLSIMGLASLFLLLRRARYHTSGAE